MSVPIDPWNAGRILADSLIPSHWFSARMANRTREQHLQFLFPGNVEVAIFVFDANRRQRAFNAMDEPGELKLQVGRRRSSPKT